jgi:hypothetical protein
MVIILKTNKVNAFVSSVLFVFWYHSPNFLDTPRKDAVGTGESHKTSKYFVEATCGFVTVMRMQSNFQALQPYDI